MGNIIYIMSSIALNKLSKSEKDEMAVTYASVLLHSCGKPVTEDNINKVLEAAGLSVESHVPFLYVKALKTKDMSDLIQNAGSVSVSSNVVASDNTESKKEDSKKEEVKEEEVQEDIQLGGGLFGDDDDDW